MSRSCLRAPETEIYECAELLRRAADAHLLNRPAEATDLFVQSNRSVVREWLESIWGKGSPYVRYRSIPEAPPILAKSERIESRMPTSTEKIALHRRDRFNCRFCGIPVVRSEVRKHLHLLYPEAIPWGRTNATQHAAFQALWAQYDHILPHARGGTNVLENMVLTCAACNFGRMNYTLEEVGLDDPRNREPVTTTWSGLEDVLPPGKRIVLWCADVAGQATGRHSVL